MGELACRLNTVKSLVKRSATHVGRNSNEVTIVAVSKRHPAESVVEAVLAGLIDIGESRVQETVVKKPIVEQMLIEQGVDPATVRWHMIGKLQSNKVNKAVELFDVIQSVDSVKLAKKLSVVAQKIVKRIEILIEVNISGESAKGGVKPDELTAFIGEIAELPAIIIKGLMTIGPLTDDESRIRTAFETFRQLRDDVAKQQSAITADCELSMGMSGDYQLAIESGSTIVRIGTAIFGIRPNNTGA